MFWGRQIMTSKILYLAMIGMLSTACQFSHAQTEDVRQCFQNIVSIFKEYNIETPDVHGSRCPNPSLEAKNLNISYEYPNMIISYYLAYKGFTFVAGHTPGRRTIAFSLADTNIREGYKWNSFDLQSLDFRSESGIEITKNGKKDLLTSWTLYTSPLVCEKLGKELRQFKFLVWKTGFTGSIGKSTLPNNKTQTNKVAIKLKKEDSGIYTVPCKVNGLSLRFIFDTGATNVSISNSEAIFMLKNGYLDPSDIVGNQRFTTASGDIIEGTKIIIRKIEIGGMILQNVEASVVHSTNAPLLLGQSVLRRLGTFEIDYNSSSLFFYK